jgi:hypothetical protein
MAMRCVRVQIATEVCAISVPFNCAIWEFADIGEAE